MPIYEYRCRACDEEFEELVRSDTRDEEIECPRCGEHHAERKLSTFSTAGLGSSCSGGGASCGGSSGFS